MAQRSRIIQTGSGNATIGGGKRHVDGDDDDAGSGISILPLNNKASILRAFSSICIGCAAVFLSQHKLWRDECKSVAGDPTEDIWVGIRGGVGFHG